MELARNKNGDLVIGHYLQRKKRYEQKLEEVSTPYGDKEIKVDDYNHPLEPIEWDGTYDIIKDESVFTDKIKNLTWEQKPIRI